MAHALPEPEPQPSPELFTKSFWLITIARVVRGAAVGGTAVLGAGQIDHLGAVPWGSYIAGCVVGALMSLGAALTNQLIPDTTTAATVVARFTGQEH